MPLLPLAPVALFAYRRTSNLTQVLDRLEACVGFSGTNVFIFSDGPKPGAEADVMAVRRLVRDRLRPNMSLVEAPRNQGLARAIISGVQDMCERFGRVIILEDDLLPSPSFLAWFNRALDRYAQDERVWQVSGHQFPVPEFRDRRQGMFLNFATSWSWGTWKRAWGHFDADATGWEVLAENAALRTRFDFGGAYPYAAMLEDQIAGRVDSWAIRWWWSMFRAGALGLFPPRALVANVGDDPAATHRASRLARLFKPAQATMQEMPALPEAVALDIQAEQAVQRFLRAQTRRQEIARSVFGRLNQVLN